MNHISDPESSFINDSVGSSGCETQADVETSGIAKAADLSTLKNPMCVKYNWIKFSFS